MSLVHPCRPLVFLLWSADMAEPIYLDFNATTPVADEVRAALLPHLSEAFGNPSSSHAYGARARAAVDRAREQVAGLLGCDPGEVTFTSGGTESNNLAIFGVLAARPDLRRVVVSAVEHPATSHPARVLAERGFEVETVPVDARGQVDPDEVARRVGEGPALVSIMHAQNETGTLQPIARVASEARARGAIVHTDAAQSVGKVPTRVDDLGVDLLSVAGHKLYAPPGVGALYVRRGTAIGPVTFGAGHERGLRPGTENVPGVVALGAACALAARRLEEDERRISALAARLLAELQRGVEGLTLNGHPTERLPNTLNVSFPGVVGGVLLANAPEILASTGSACHDASEHPSAVLAAMGVSAERARGAVRLSLGRTTTDEDVGRAATALIQAYHRLTARPPTTA